VAFLTVPDVHEDKVHLQSAHDNDAGGLEWQISLSAAHYEYFVTWLYQLTGEGQTIRLVDIDLEAGVVYRLGTVYATDLSMAGDSLVLGLVASTVELF
jgi:type II secretory pathway component PulM